MSESDASDNDVHASESWLPVETINQLVSNHSQELQLRGRELEIRSKEVDNNADFAKASLDAKALDNKHYREVYNLLHQRTIRLVGFGASLVAAISLALIIYDKESILYKLIELAVVATGSFAAGYGWRSYSGRKGQQNQDE